MLKQDHVRGRTTLKDLFLLLWPHFMRQKVLFFTTLLAVFAVAAAGRVAVYLFGAAIDRGILKQDRDFVIFVALGLFFLEAGRCFMTFLQSYLFAKLGNRILYEIRDELVRHVHSLPITFFEKNPTGRIVTRLTSDVVSFGEIFTQGLINVFASFISLSAIVFAMGMISVRMTLIALAIAPPLLYITVLLSRRILLVLRDSKAKLAAINAFVAENVSGMRLLQLYGRVKRNSDRFHRLSADYRDQQLRAVHLYALLWPAVSFFNAISVAAALYFGGVLTLENAVSTGSMIAFILHVRAFMDPLQMILEKYQILQNSLSGAERIFTLLEETPEELTVTLEGFASERLSGEVEFRNVSFTYGPGLRPALDRVNLRVEPGQRVALVGRTGSGKSTLITLLQRFYDPTDGGIYLDGRLTSSIPRASLRERIGVVQQDTFMFRGSIADNIGLRDPRISRLKIEDAARAAHLSEMLERRSEGLDSHVEERGANLSQGERQLIAFARILAFDPDILILDEATANIDSKTERLIQDATERVCKGRTSFIIAHRLSTVANCDQIIRLENGRRLEPNC